MSAVLVDPAVKPLPIQASGDIIELLRHFCQAEPRQAMAALGEAVRRFQNGAQRFACRARDAMAMTTIRRVFTLILSVTIFAKVVLAPGRRQGRQVALAGRSSSISGMPTRHTDHTCNDERSGASSLRRSRRRQKFVFDDDLKTVAWKLKRQRWNGLRLSHWPSRDPIGENGGNNLYYSFNNGSINSVDYIGLLTDKAVALEILDHWARPNGNEGFTRGYTNQPIWGEYLIRAYPVVQALAQGEY